MSTSRGKVRCSPGPGAFLPRFGSGLAWDLVRAAEQPRFSRPREFDPDLAERAKERIRAEKEGRLETDPKRSMMADLGFDAEDDGGMGSDGASSEAEELAAHGDAAAVGAHVDDVEALHVQVSALEEQLRHAVRDRDELGTRVKHLKQLSRSQAAIMQASHRTQVIQRDELLWDMLEVLRDYETRLESAGDAVPDSAADAFGSAVGALPPAPRAEPSEAPASADGAGAAAAVAEEWAQRAEAERRVAELERQCEALRGEVERAREGVGAQAPAAAASAVGEEEVAELRRRVEEAEARRAAAEGKAQQAKEARSKLKRLAEHAKRLQEREKTLKSRVVELEEADALGRAQAAEEEAEALRQEVRRAQQEAEARAESEVEALRAEVQRAQQEAQAREEEQAKAQRRAEEAEAAARGHGKTVRAAEARTEELQRALRREEARLGATMAGLAALKRLVATERRRGTHAREAAQALRAAVGEEVARVRREVARALGQERKRSERVLADFGREVRERKRLFNLVQELRGNIRVFCRVRPPVGEERGEGMEEAVALPREGEVTLLAKGREKSWEFDRVFAPALSNAEVYEDIAPLVVSALDGYNVCIFAYGQTGSGKTHTMEGCASDLGMNYRALSDLFRLKGERATQSRYTISISLLEIYNERVVDLLASQRGDAELRVRGGGRTTHIPGLTRTAVESFEEVRRAYEWGTQARATAGTQMNARSSRSHCMLSVYVEGESVVTGERLRGKLHLVDLAGSERLSKSGATGDRLREAQAINKSLSALGTVIHKRANKSGHIPYRDSTLTHMLQDSLAADSKTLMFVCASPVAYNADETFCTFEFGARARTVELGKATRHVDKRRSPRSPDSGSS